MERTRTDEGGWVSVKCHTHSGGPFSDVDEVTVSVLASYLAPPLSLLYTIILDKETMQNASGLWGKVKSQAQQAGSMAQGAINVSEPLLCSTSQH